MWAPQNAARVVKRCIDQCKLIVKRLVLVAVVPIIEIMSRRCLAKIPNLACWIGACKVGAWQVPVRYPKGAWQVPKRCLTSGRCLAGAWQVPGRCLAGAW